MDIKFKSKQQRDQMTDIWPWDKKEEASML